MTDGDGLRVEPNDLDAKAIQIEDIEYGRAPDAPAAPDALSSTGTAISNLDLNATYMQKHQEYGQRKGERLAETLRHVATAYRKVDEHAKAGVTDGAPIEPVVPQGNSLPSPAIPTPMGIPAAPDASGYSDVEATQASLSDGDHGRSLQAAAQRWISNGNELQAAAEKFKEPVQNWEGEAAQSAYRRFDEFGDYLDHLGTSWQHVADEANRLADLHIKALFDHTSIYQKYMDLKPLMLEANAKKLPTLGTIFKQMMDLQRESDELREAYARAINPHRILPPNPPLSSAPTTPVTKNGTRRPAGGEQVPGAGGSGPGGGGGGPESGASGQPSLPESPQVSPVSAKQGEQGGGQGAGAGGGSPSGGGGSPSGGGGPGSGMPGLPSGPGGAEGLPRLPDDPSLHPAAAGGGSGGGGGGGVPKMPLQPGVGAVAVGPGPASTDAHGGASPAGGAGGGMGGMGGGGAPMGGGHGQGAGKEKRRTPGLSPDEDLYTEDRQWTEGYIGKPQRKPGAPPKERREE